MNTALTASPAYRACSADGIRAEFGVSRGEQIRDLDSLILGDVYLCKHDTKWMPVQPAGDAPTGFSLDIAANLPVQNLTILADLVFMTTTVTANGRRVDAHAATCNGRLFFVAETEFQPGTEYVLIDFVQRVADFVPALVPDPVPVPAAVATQGGLRLIG